MEIKKYKPVTSSQRHLIGLNKLNLSKKPLLKKSIITINSKSGWNNTGHITSFHKGNGHKKSYRKVEFLNSETNIGIITSIEYDPYRNSNIVLIYNFKNKNYYYRLHTNYSKIGDIIEIGENAKSLNGNTLPLYKIPIGSLIHNISMTKNKKSQLSWSAGTYSILLDKTAMFVWIKLSSGKIKILSNQCFATIGVVANGSTFLINKGKAGRSRWLNCRPRVRGVAMNPIDHPHGGGEGKTSGGRKTPWGKPIKKWKKK